jgi:hypothetical protein
MGGGMKDFTIAKAEMPCNDCLITNWVASLEFNDGSTANANTGMWLHHVVYFNLNRTDTICDSYPDRFAASGNERTPVDITVGG